MTDATFVTSMGSFTVRLMPEHAPKTVANFVELAQGSKGWTDPRDGSHATDPLYDGDDLPPRDRQLHDPGGDPTGTGTGGPGYTFEDEVPTAGPRFDRPGLLAMANAGPELQRLPVLRDRRRRRLVVRQAHHLRRGHRRLRRGRGDLSDPDEGPGTGRSRTSS